MKQRPYDCASSDLPTCESSSCAASTAPQPAAAVASNAGNNVFTDLSMSVSLEWVLRLLGPATPETRQRYGTRPFIVLMKSLVAAGARTWNEDSQASNLSNESD